MARLGKNRASRLHWVFDGDAFIGSFMALNAEHAIRKAKESANDDARAFKRSHTRIEFSSNVRATDVCPWND